MQYTPCVEDFEKTFSFWNNLSAEEKELFLANTTVRQYKKGANVHRGGDDCLGVLILKRGQLRTYMLSEDGRDITLYRIFENDVCVLSASCVLESITFDVFIEAVEDSEVLVINAAFFKNMCEENIHVKCFSYQMTTSRFSDVMWAMQQILFMSTDKRLAIFLIDEMAKNNSDVLKITHEQIAKYMGSAREVVSRLLKYFVQEKIVRLSRGGIAIIDKEKLRELTK